MLLFVKRIVTLLNLVSVFVGKCITKGNENNIDEKRGAVEDIAGRKNGG